jgi:AcrR family transcriptional regulator
MERRQEELALTQVFRAVEHEQRTAAEQDLDRLVARAGVEEPGGRLEDLLNVGGVRDRDDRAQADDPEREHVAVAAEAAVNEAVGGEEVGEALEGGRQAWAGRDALMHDRSAFARVACLRASATMYGTVHTLAYFTQMTTSTPRRKYSPRLPREERREQLLDAALRVLAEHGFGGMSMEAVAREADIAKTVVYDAFGGLRELLAALLEREQERALATVAAAMPAQPMKGDPVELLVQGMTTVLEGVRRNPDTWRLILLPADGTPPAMRETVERNRRAILKQLEPLVAWGLRERGLEHLDAELASHSILAGAENAVRLTLTQPRRFTPKRLAGFTRDVIAALGNGRR